MKKTILAITLATSIAMANIPALVTAASTPTAETKKIIDIAKHWAESSIIKYGDPEIFSTNGGKYSPNQIITRGEFVLMLHKALDIKIKYFKAPDIKEFFQDVDNEDACASPLYDLVVTNIVDRKGSFHPNEALPRDEMIHYIINALKDVTGGNYALIKMLPAPFADDDQITPVYKNDIIEAVLLKIVFGREHNKLEPLSGGTRAEAAAVIDRLMALLESLRTSVEVTPSAKVNDTGITMKLSIANLSKEPVTLSHTSGQKYNFSLLDADHNVLYNWAADKSFIMALSSTVIGAGKTLDFTETLDAEAIKSFKDGIKYVTANIVGESENFVVNPDGYSAEVE